MEALGAKREHIVAGVGPCISQAAYEVGPEFQPRFNAADPANATFFATAKRERHWQFDLPGYIAQRLRDAGVDKIDALAPCTYEREADFFSYRRTTPQGTDAGKSRPLR
jgi:copper oxidase (laccase) domain-containing protein